MNQLHPPGTEQKDDTGFYRSPIGIAKLLSLALDPKDPVRIDFSNKNEGGNTLAKTSSPLPHLEGVTYVTNPDRSYSR